MKVLSALAYTILGSSDPAAEQTDEFVAGLINGLIGKNDLTEIEKCLKNTQLLEQNIEVALADVERGDMNDVIKGVREFGDVLMQLPQDMATCTSIQPDVLQIYNWALKFQNPVTIVETLQKNLKKNWTEVTKDIAKAQKDFNSKNYEVSGEDIAEIIVLSLGKVSDPVDSSDNMYLY